MLALIREYVMGALFIHQRRSSDHGEQRPKVRPHKERPGQARQTPVHKLPASSSSFRISRDLIQNCDLCCSPYQLIPCPRTVTWDNFPYRPVSDGGCKIQSFVDNIADNCARLWPRDYVSEGQDTTLWIK